MEHERSIEVDAVHSFGSSGGGHLDHLPHGRPTGFGRIWTLREPVQRARPN
jgi:hypothetical protein